jgi:hypothetical protein
MISKFVSKKQKDWNLYLPYLMMAYRSSVHDTMGETPCFMMMGREVTLPIDLVFVLNFLLSCNKTPSPVLKLGNVHEMS